jgi:mono/diheme cytochrome c family protein
MRRNVLAAGSALTALALAAPVLAATPATGNPKKGKAVFTSTNCGACHTLKAAAALGNIGPNLDKAAAHLTEATLVKAVTNGGATVMIRDVAAFVYVSTHH